ncbi:uncharacterized protein J7T54_002207 [Emericellopsis cladophorae]|uniref:EGF-like domain-containing protein n=1 Tax=Emericellopsis cladophorae TaxID=2686198 RepID=A0A9P9Y4U2_9HYPO|nr:uncharacterized protein J7T54_002207 [Emericellopsis cladophorae]KAI6783045.1 hypothetical protein J7T54_002207 [Emericellopsis cladophorae]
MSQSQNGWNMDRPRAGSVKRAREQAATAQGRAPRRPPPPPSSATPTMPAATPLEDGSSSPRGYLSPPPRRHMPPPSQPPPTIQLPPAPPSRARVPPGSEGKSGISRPSQAPQWPLPPGSPLTPVNNKSSSSTSNSNNYQNDYFQPRQPDRPTQAPPRPLQAPARPARPSRIPSMVDKTGPQEPTPVFRNPQQASDSQDVMEQGLSPPMSATPATPISRLTTSSVGSIPEFPTPGASTRASQEPPAQQMPMPPRRSVNLGPPPAGRRGPSSYYSNATFVSPIPEESTRSHGSYASSAAIPGVWNPASPLTPTTYDHSYTDSYYDDSVTDKSRDSQGDDFGDESKLVRSASVGKKGKAALVDNKPGATTSGASTEAASAAAPARPLAQPVQPFATGTGYIEDSTSSETIRTAQRSKEAQPTVEKEPQLLMPVAYNATPPLRSPSASPLPVPERSWSKRISGIKRPPNLDIDAVRAAEARGSITSLPDLIKRATRLAAMIERGKRPASRFENFTDYLDKPRGGDGDGDGDSSFNDRHQSGLSDMLAAFPPPGHQQRTSPNGQARRSRTSWFRNTSWPLIPGAKDDQGQHDGAHNEVGPPGATAAATAEKPRPVRRKCCGMPPWAFVLLMILLLCAIAAAIVVPLQFFVFKTLGNHPTPLSALDQCKADLVCRNGGTNVLSQGTCACICTNGFTGADCGAQEEIVDDSDELDEATGVASRSEASSKEDELTFDVTEEVLDFARVAVLYILQEAAASDAEAAQTSLQRFFSGGQAIPSAISQKDAQNVTVGAKDHTVNLVDFGIDLGDGVVGKASSSKSRRTIRRTSSRSSHSRHFGL